LFEFPNITDEIKGKIRNGNMVRFEAAFDLHLDMAENLKCFKSEKSAVLHLDFIISPLGQKDFRHGLRQINFPASVAPPHGDNMTPLTGLPLCFQKQRGILILQEVYL
jgi:hypothetical protein